MLAVIKYFSLWLGGIEHKPLTMFMLIMMKEYIWFIGKNE